MGRVSKADAARHREQVVAAAARLFKERGVNGISLSDLMADVGLTHGGFYRQFASKEALAAEATRLAFQELGGTLEGMTERHSGDWVAAREELADYYLSGEHRDDPGNGCPAAGLCGEVAHEGRESPLRSAYVDGIQSFVDVLGDFSGDSADRADKIATLCTLVGGLLLARATAGDPVSDEILDAARNSVTG
jgi:TetR/AcrR family transcriptional regulator, transcriptional repressor for nem operon